MNDSKIIMCILDGREASGKDTAIRTLQGQWNGRFSAGRELLSFREPGSTPLGKQCRAEMTNTDIKMTLIQEFSLFFAGRFSLWREIVRQANKGRSGQVQVVLLNRSWLSTYAYQIVGHDAGESMTQVFKAFVLDLMTFMHTELPKLEVHHFIFDVDDDEAARRLATRPANDSGNEITQFDEPLFQHRVNMAYRNAPSLIAAGDLHPPAMVHTATIIDANGDQDTVYANFVAKIQKILTAV